ncbi:GerAB/ArcD/ProY family transporter [Desmospora profundinema]|uniref:Spore germination protein (Amino acid permease) n=1 Tax=Desmospora profundinema TaxID=1571184 RepID=A0ABU1IHU1_9BACL|nr:GerAB/ArcD/ProY family transporter [Desmospora profundinema]MDR6224344.1 spore germination protein (amino acid permease) [Desmospora profundinema]
MTQKKISITPTQFMLIVLQTQVGAGIIGLPFGVHAEAKGDSWLAVLIAGVITQLLILLIWTLNKRFPSQSIYEFLPKLLGKWLGKLLILGYSLFFVMLSSTVMIRYFGVVHIWMLPETPRWVINGLLFAAAVYLGISNLRQIARLYVFASGVVAIHILIATLTYFDPFTTTNIDYILPLGQIAGPINLLKGANQSFFAMTGFETMLVLYPFVEGSPAAKLKAASLANLWTTLIYVFITFTALVVFSPVEMGLIPEPVIYMLKAFRFQLVERPDLYFISLWVVSIFTSMFSFLYLAILGITRFFNHHVHRKWVLWVVLLGYAITFIPFGHLDVENLSEVVDILSYIFIVGIPPILLILSYLFGKQGEKGEVR